MKSLSSSSSRFVTSLCTPAKIYLILAIVMAISAILNRVNVAFVAVKLVFALAWSYFLGWLCRRGYKNISWGLVLLPYIAIMFTIVGLYQISNLIHSSMRVITLQPSVIGIQESMTSLNPAPY